MKIKKIIIAMLLVIYSMILMTGCGSKNSTESEDKNTLTSITPGIYIGEANEETSFIPKLTLNNDKSFNFQISKIQSFDGEYHIDNNMVILTITEDKCYTFSKKGENYKLNEEIEGSIKKNCEFKLWGSLDNGTSIGTEGNLSPEMPVSEKVEDTEESTEMEAQPSTEE